MGKRIVVVGGVACGGKTAARLRRLDPEAEITVLEKGAFLSYAGCGLPYYIEGVVKEYKELMCTPIGVIRDASFFRKVKHVDVLTQHMATSIDRKAKTVTAVALESGEEKTFPYDTLVLSTGASPIKPPIPGSDLDHVFTLWTMDDALGLKNAVESGTVKRATVVGSGLIGMEVVEALHANGIEVSLVDLLEYPLPTMLDRDFGHGLMNKLAAQGVMFYGGEKVTEIVGEGGRVTGVKTDYRELASDMVLLAIGVKPNIHLAQEAGLEIGATKSISVNSHMQTSDPDIYAGGDCVELEHVITRKRVRQPMGSAANRHGRVIADNIAGMQTRFMGVAGSAIMKAFDATIGRTGLNEKEAAEAGFDPVAVTVTDADKPHFMPGAGVITIRLVADRKTRKVLGAQLFGPGQVDKRLDVLVTAITGGQTVDDVADIDLAYAPPYATALDPVTHAANALRNKMDGLMTSYSPQELQAKLGAGENPVLLDVRTAPEIEQQGQLPFEASIVHIPLGSLWERAPELPRDREIITYCKISVRGWDACSILRSHGFENRAVLEGGVVGWPYKKV